MGTKNSMAAAFALLVLAASALSSLPTPCLAVTSPYVRPRARATLSVPAHADADGQTPQQVRRPRFLECCSLSCLASVVFFSTS
jgi:hypothetical protein